GESFLSPPAARPRWKGQRANATLSGDRPMTVATAPRMPQSIKDTALPRAVEYSREFTFLRREWKNPKSAFFVAIVGKFPVKGSLGAKDATTKAALQPGKRDIEFSAEVERSWAKFEVKAVVDPGKTSGVAFDWTPKWNKEPLPFTIGLSAKF